MTRGGSGPAAGASSHRVGSGQHDVGIGPAKPERVDAGVRPLGRLHRLDVANQPQIQRLERDFRVGLLAVDGGGMISRSRASAALSSPAIPDAGSRWPILVLTDPMGSGIDRLCPRECPTAAASIGSPAAVPVPCISKNARSSGAIPALWYTARNRDACADSLGSDRPIVRPSELTAGRPYHGVDPIFGGDRVRERFQDYDRAALAANVAVGPLVEGKAAAAPGEHRGAREPDKGIGREQKVDRRRRWRRRSFCCESPRKHGEGRRARTSTPCRRRGSARADRKRRIFGLPGC